MKRLIFILFGLLNVVCSYAQKEGNIWYFGQGVGLDFNSGTPVVLNDGATDVHGGEGEACATISDTSGKLLFYTNGVKVWTKQHTIMPALAEADLMGNVSSSQGAIIVPKPGSALMTGGYPRFYYIFTVPSEEVALSRGGSANPRDGLRWTLIDMSLNGGLGDVVKGASSMNVRVTPEGQSVMEALTAIPDNSTPQGYWVITHSAANFSKGDSANRFYVSHITAKGVSAPVKFHAGYAIGKNRLNSDTKPIGSLKSNYTYTSIALAFYGNGDNGRVQLFDFDNTKGTVGPLTHDITNFYNRNEIYGIEFSPDDRLLYVTELSVHPMIHQFQLFPAAKVNTDSARYTVASPNIPGQVGRIGALQLGPDGKIYVAQHRDWADNNHGSFVGVINHPNIVGEGCKYDGKALFFNAERRWVTHGLPQFTRKALPKKRSTPKFR